MFLPNIFTPSRWLGVKIFAVCHIVGCALGLLQVFEAASKVPAANVRLLEDMITSRKEMAELVGCDSYSKYKAWGSR
jgi:hypothetical protein